MPTGKFEGDAGAMVIEDKVAATVGADEHAAVPNIKAANKPKVRQETRNRRCLIFIIIKPSSLEFYSAV